MKEKTLFDDEYEVCVVCGNSHAELLCDALIGRRQELHDGSGFCDDGKHEFRVTCDAPLCETCAVNAGHMHTCGSSGCLHDSIDLCPYHAEHGGIMVHPEEGGFPVMTVEEINRERARVEQHLAAGRMLRIATERNP